MTISLKQLRKIIREEVGRNLHSDKTAPFNFTQYKGYEVEVAGGLQFGWSVSVKFQGKPISNIAVLPTEEEANHHARMLIDKHRINQDLSL